MENASKALIIAGAILISILLISVGIMIIGSTDGITEGMTSEMSATEITAFNSKFTKYEGSKESATNVKNLIREIATNNTVNEAKETTDYKHVKLTLDGTDYIGENVNNATIKVKSTKKYAIVCSVNATSGLVETVTITEYSKATP